MKQYLLILAFATLGSCAKNVTDESASPDTDRQSVRFTTEVSSRGVSTTRDNIKEFAVFCYDLKGTVWNATTSIPNKMNNLKVTRVGTTTDWTYGESIDWDGGDGRRFTFLGFSPYATGTYVEYDNPLGNNIEVVTPVKGIPTLNFETQSEVTQQVDLLLAAPHISITPQENVYMMFNHALAQIRFRGYSAQQGVAPLSIAINDVQYKGSVPVNGTDIAWTVEADKTNFTIENNFPVVSVDESKPTDLSTGGRAFMLPPQDLTGNTTSKIVIVTRINGADITKEYIIKENWEAGKSYIYTIALGGNPTEEIIVTDVTIKDWQMGSLADSDVGLTGKSYTLTFNANGGSGTKPSNITLETGSLCKIPGNSLTKAGSTFNGWNTLENGTGTSYQTGGRILIEDSNITLYAQWK